MKKQKYILRSRTIWSAIFTLAIAVFPLVKEGVESDFDRDLMLQIISMTITTAGTIVARYMANDELYTPKGLPGRDCVSTTERAWARVEEDN